MRANQRPRWEPLRLVHLGSATLIVIVLILAALSGGGARPAAAMAAQAPRVGPLQAITATATATGTATRTPTLPAATATGAATATATRTPTAIGAATPTPTATAPPVGIAQTPTPTVTPTPTITQTPTATATPDTGNPNTCNSSVDPDNVPDEFEPDNTRVEASPINVPDSQDHNLCSITSGPDEDWVQFPGLANQEYTVQTTNLSSTVDTFLEVQGPDGFLATNDDGGPDPSGSQIIFVPARNDTIFVRVRQASKRRFLPEERNLPRNYTISIGATVAPTATPTNTPVEATVTPTPTPSPCRDEFEFDDDPDDAEALFVQKVQRHVLCGDGDVDWVFFDAVADKPYRIFTSDLAPGVDTLIVLYGEDAESIIATNDDFPGLGLASRIDLTSSVTTRYYLMIQDSTGHGAEDFSYLLHLESDGTPNGGPCEDIFEFDGLPTTAREILLGQSQSRTFCPEGDADWISFFALGGKSYSLTTSDLSVGTDTLLTIFSGVDAETIIAQDDDGGGGLASRADFVAPFDGIYYAQIKNAGDIGGRGQRYVAALTSGGITIQPTPTPAGRATGTGTPTPGSGMPPGTQVVGTATPTPGIGTATPTPTFDPNLVGTATVTPSVTGTAGVSRAVPPAAPGDALSALQGPLVTADFADASFASTWARADEPVRQQRAARSWYWGDRPGPTHRELYKGANGGERLVQYFGKARMEINDPAASRDGRWFVTNGLLAREMIGGFVQVGDEATERRQPPAVAVAGDGDKTAPTYASFTNVASLDGDRRVPNRVGQPVVETINRAGKIRQQPELAGRAVKNHYYIPETGHNIPDVFWNFMQQRGVVYSGQGYVEDVVADWAFTFGLPLTEAYWTRAKVAGVERDVLVQVFERRVLTYTPDNPAAWRVEMGNVGEHYYRWRYGGQ